MQEQEKRLHVTIQLFDASNIAQMLWPETDDGRYARQYLLPLIEQGPLSFIANAQTTCMALLIDGQLVLPVTVNQREYDNSYVCSPYSHYVSYAKEELVLLKNPVLSYVFARAFDGLGALGKLCSINRVVHVNNWLLSTNLYPHITPEQVSALIPFLSEHFPQHTIIFRSLHAHTNGALLSALQQAGCVRVASRQVYLVRPSDPTALNAKARWLLKRDHALLARQGYRVVGRDDLRAEDVPRIVELYNALYLGKYSLYNPMFTEAFIMQALQHKILELVALQKDGRIDAVLGYFWRNGVMTTPLFGYDTTLPQEIGLYRMLSVTLFQHAQERGLLLHESSGAAQFKRNRGAFAVIEYSAVYTRHLPLHRRLYWQLLALLLDKIGVPFMQKQKL